MKRTSSITVLAGFATMAAVSQDAFARGRMYHPRLGRFMQRDPIGTPYAPPVTVSARPSIARNVSSPRFTQRDPEPGAQYADGMNLYQYATGRPTNLTDPSGTVVVLMSGLWRPASDMAGIRAQLKAQLKATLKPYDRGSPRVAFAQFSWGPLKDDGKYDRYPYTSVWLAGSYDDFVRSQYDDYVARKKADRCSLEQFVAVGHSSGASAILNQLRDGYLSDKSYPPAYLAMVDPVLSSDGHDVSNVGHEGFGVWVYYQKKDLLQGKPVSGADANVEVKGKTHLGIVNDQGMINEISRKAAEFYKRRVDLEVKANPAKEPWDTGTGKVTGNRIKGNAW